MEKESFLWKYITAIVIVVAITCLMPIKSKAEVDKKYKVDLRLLPLLEESRKNLQTEKGLNLAKQLYAKSVSLKDTLAQMYALGDQLTYYMHHNDSINANKVATTMRSTASKSHRYVYYYYHAWHQQVTWLVRNNKLYAALSEGSNMLKSAAKETDLKPKVRAGITFLCYDILHSAFEARNDNINAEKVLLKSISITTPHSNLNSFTLISYIGLAKLYLDEKEYGKALDAVDKGMKIETEFSGNKRVLLEQKALTLFDIGRKAEFTKTYKEIVNSSGSQKEPSVSLQICKLIIERKYAEAHKLANDCKTERKRCLENLKIYKQERKWKEAYDCEQKLREIEKRKQQQLMSNDLAELSTMYETEKLKTSNVVLELENKQAESQRQRLVIIFVSLIAIIVVTGILVLLRNSKKHVKTLNAKNLELARARDKAEKSDKMKSRFIENISHEIRTPLNAIVGFSDILCTPGLELSDEERAEFSTTISKNSGLLTAIVNEMIDIAELQSGTLKANIAPCNCNMVCLMAMSAVEAKKPKNVDMTYTTDMDDGDTINTDQRRLEQVIFHFLTNAEKFTTEGTINLDCSKKKRNGYVTFTVTDTGCGIPLDKQKEVFEQFEKNGKMEQGAGLGLSLCSMIANLLNADIGIDPEYTNGSRFYFAVPMI